MSKRPMPRIKFLSIKQDLINTTSTAADLGIKHHVSASTIGNVNMAGTYANYLAHKKASKTIRQDAPRLTRVQRARKAGLNPVTREQRQEKQLAEGLANLESQPTGISPDPETSPHTRLDIHYGLIREAQREADKARRLSKVAIVISVVALVLAVVK